MKLDLTDKRRWAITSLVRIVIPMVFTWVGVSAQPDSITEIGSAIGLVIWVIVSIVLSVSGRQKLLEHQPPYTGPGRNTR